LLATSKSHALVDGDAYEKLTLEDILRHTDAHVAALQDLITSLGGTPRPQPVFRNFSKATRQEFLQTARTVENLAVGTYMGTARLYFDVNVAIDVLQIAFIEARHAGWINHLVASELTNSRRITGNVYGIEQTFERALSRDEAFNFYLPYHQTLNGGPPMFYSTTPGAQNDINILNFLLALEMLKQQVYTTNTPVFYPYQRQAVRRRSTGAAIVSTDEAAFLGRRSPWRNIR
jgi:hypothetical protein